MLILQKMILGYVNTGITVQPGTGYIYQSYLIHRYKYIYIYQYINQSYLAHRYIYQPYLAHRYMYQSYLAHRYSQVYTLLQYVSFTWNAGLLEFLLTQSGSVTMSIHERVLNSLKNKAYAAILDSQGTDFLLGTTPTSSTINLLNRARWSHFRVS